MGLGITASGFGFTERGSGIRVSECSGPLRGSYMALYRVLQDYIGLMHGYRGHTSLGFRENGDSNGRENGQ